MFRNSTLMRRIVLIILCALAASTILAVVAFMLAGREMNFQAAIDNSFEQAQEITDIISDAQELSFEQINRYILAKGYSENYRYFILDDNGEVVTRVAAKDKSEANLTDDPADGTADGVGTVGTIGTGSSVGTAEMTETADSNKEEQLFIRALNVSQSKLLSSENPFSYKILETDSLFAKLLVIRSEFTHRGATYNLIQYSIVDQNSDIINQYMNILILSALAAAFFMLLPAVIFVERITAPLQKVNEVAREYEQGIYTSRADVDATGEIGELAQSFNSMAEKLTQSITTLTTERNNLDEIFNVISEGIIVIDEAGNVTFENNTFRSLFSRVPRKNLFTERLNLIPFPEVWEDIDECVSTGDGKTRDLEGTDYAFRETIVPRFGSGSSEEDRKCIGATVFFRDITDELKMERTRNDYVANISHELRTPLQTLRGLIEPLSDGMVRKEEDRQRYYGIILDETLRLSRLIDDMLELSKLQSRTLAFKTFPFDLNKLLNNLKTRFEPIMKENGITFRLMFNTGTLPTVIGNPDRVEQILIILLDNAKKYTPSGGTITISAENNDIVDKVLVSVSDTGQGIHEYDIGHIFDRFFKADRARGKKGTGLGLSIAKELLAYMGEDISVESEYGKGTSFTFTLKKSEPTAWFD